MRHIEDLRGALEMVAALIVLSIVAAGGASHGVRTRRFRSRRERARLHMATARSELQQSRAVAQLARATRLLATRTRSCGPEALDNSPRGLNNSRAWDLFSPAEFAAGPLGKVQLMRESLRCAAACRGSKTTTDAFLRRGRPNGAARRKRHAFRRAKFK